MAREKAIGAVIRKTEPDSCRLNVAVGSDQGYKPRMCITLRDFYNLSKTVLINKAIGSIILIC